MRGWGMAVCAAAGLAVAGQSFGGDSGGDASPFLRAGLGARALAMGNAGTAGQNDATDVYWNPAALSCSTGLQAAVQTTVLGADRAQQALVVSYAPRALENRQVLVWAMGWYRYSAGQELEYRVDNRPEPSKIFGDQENVFLAGSALPLAPNWHAGLMAKYYTHLIDTHSAAGLGLDAGMRWQVFSGLVLGMVAQDLFGYKQWGGDYHDSLPWVLRFGISQSMAFWQTVLNADLKAPWRSDLGRWQVPGYHLGIESAPWQGLALRLGIDQGEITAGLGLAFDLQWGHIALDYAFSTQPLLLGNVKHLFTLKLRLPMIEPYADPVARTEGEDA